MLPSELLIYRQSGETIVPKKLAIDNRIIGIASNYIECFQEYLGKTQGELDRELAKMEGDSPDYRVRRGFAHILKSSFSTFEIISPLEPQTLRQKVFTEAAKKITVPDRRSDTLETVARSLSNELKRVVSLEEVEKEFGL